MYVFCLKCDISMQNTSFRDNNQGKVAGQETRPSLPFDAVVTIGLSSGAESQPMTAFEWPDHMVERPTPDKAVLAIHAMAAYALCWRPCSKLDGETSGLDWRKREAAGESSHCGLPVSSCVGDSVDTGVSKIKLEPAGVAVLVAALAIVVHIRVMTAPAPELAIRRGNIG